MRVLFLTHRLPYPPNRGDRIRAFQIVRALVPDVEVELLSLVHDPLEATEVPRLEQRLGVRVTPVAVPYYRNRVEAAVALAGSRPLTHVLLNAPGIMPAIRRIVDERRPDLVLAYCSSMAQFAMLSPLAEIPMVLDMVDLDSEKWSDMAEKSGLPLSWIYRREARQLGAFEREAVAHARATLVVNEREAEAVRRRVPGAHVTALPNGVDLWSLQPPPAPVDEPRVIFCGVMNYAPNADGVCWFVREVWPLVRKLVPAATFTIVGSDPTEQVRKLASVADGIEVTGRVPEVSRYLWSSTMSVAPLHVARGVQNKVLEAVAAGLPTVVTPAVLEGLPNEVRVACRLAESAEDFARQTTRILKMTGAERRAMAARANLAALSWEQQMSPLRHLLQDALSQAPGSGPWVPGRSHVSRRNDIRNATAEDTEQMESVERDTVFTSEF
ncbi:MAG: TIGR03087 family PEP-CTERM/XrtA system glycosyltransferase [Acidobacteria bacterium]|nr:TIGR03087 family PEP-CTERM/XrtA system glycosyltransferase [Acidobacteriota bacterium]